MLLYNECPDCNTEIEYNSDNLGDIGKCPNCSKVYRIDTDGDYGQDSVVILDFEPILTKDDIVPFK